MAFQKFYNFLGPKMGQFGKFTLPLSFGRYPTHLVTANTRNTGYATVFDVSHMGIFETRDKDNLEELVNVNLNKLRENRSRLSVILDKSNGRVLDDLIVGNVNDDKYRLVVNANNRGFFKNHKFLKETDKNILAIQGHGASRLVEQVLKTDLRHTYFMDNKTLDNGIEICRCGYTGEDGFELYIPNGSTDWVADKIYKLSRDSEKIMFGGLIERDILRMEASLWLSGTDFNPELNIPFDALGSKWLVSPEYRKNLNLSSPIRFSRFVSNRPMKPGLIFNELGEAVGFITSSTKSFTLDKFIALGYSNPNLNLKKLYTLVSRNREKYKIPIELTREHFIEPRYYRSKTT